MDTHMVKPWDTLSAFFKLTVKTEHTVSNQQLTMNTELGRSSPRWYQQMVYKSLVLSLICDKLNKNIQVMTEFRNDDSSSI